MPFSEPFVGGVMSPYTSLWIAIAVRQNAWRSAAWATSIIVVIVVVVVVVTRITRGRRRWQ